MNELSEVELAEIVVGVFVLFLGMWALIAISFLY